MKQAQKNPVRTKQVQKLVDGAKKDLLKANTERDRHRVSAKLDAVVPKLKVLYSQQTDHVLGDVAHNALKSVEEAQEVLARASHSEPAGVAAARLLQQSLDALKNL